MQQLVGSYAEPASVEPASGIDTEAAQTTEPEASSVIVRASAVDAAAAAAEKTLQSAAALALAPKHLSAAAPTFETFPQTPRTSSSEIQPA